MKIKYISTIGLLTVVSYSAMAITQTCSSYGGILSGNRCAIDLNDLQALIDLPFFGPTLVPMDVNAGMTDNPELVTITTSGGRAYLNMPSTLAADGRIDIIFSDAQELDVLLPNGLNTKGGDDILTNISAGIATPGSLTGNVNLGDGNDKVEVENFEFRGGIIDAGEGNDIAILRNVTFLAGTSINMGNGDNAGDITNTSVNGNISSGSGNDSFILKGNTTITGNVDSGDGVNNTIMQETTKIIGNITGGNGSDTLIMSGDTSVSGVITANAGDDTIILDDNASVGVINMDDGSDTITINGAAVTLNGVLDGGDDIGTADGWTDTLTFNSWAGLAPTMNNWEVIQLNGTSMDLGSTSIIGAGNFNIDAASTLMTKAGPHSISGNVNNLGVINMNDGNISGGLSIGGDYSGSGTLIMDVNLANEQSDILTVGGDVNAQGRIDFQRVGNDHIGGGSNILIIDAPNDNQATVSNFQFDASIGGSAYVWAMNNVAGEGFYIGYTAPTDPPIGPTDPTDPPIGPVDPTHVLPAIPAYVALPSIGREFAMSQISTLHDRLGELRRLDGWIGSGPQNIETAMGRAWSNQFSYIPDSWNIWAKGIIGGLDIDGNETYQLDGTYGGFDMGVDRKFTTNKDNFIIYGGLFGGYRTGDFTTDGKSDRYLDSLIGADIDVDTWSIGAYATLFWNNTSYLDLVANYMSLDTNIANDDYYINNNTTLASYSDSIDGDAFTLSAEYGHRIDLANDWILEPQAQLTYLSVRWDDVNNSTYDVNYENGNYLTARAGLRVEKTFEIKDGSEVKPWVRANILHEFGDEVTVDINNESYNTYDLGTYAQFDIGATYVIKDNIQLYGSGNYRTDFSNYDTYEVGGGLRVSW